MEIMDGLNSMKWYSIGALPNGVKIELADIPPRDKFKYGYDLWTQGLSVDAYTIGRTYKASLRSANLGDGIWLMNFDSKGRLINLSYTGTVWQKESIPSPEHQAQFTVLTYPKYKPEIHRLLGGTWLMGKWTDTQDRTKLFYRPEVLPPDHKFIAVGMKVLDLFVGIINGIDTAPLKPEARRIVEKLRQLNLYDSEGLKKYEAEFQRLLGLSEKIAVEPPELALQHYHAIPVVVEDGCGGGCTFCSLYNRKIRIRSSENVHGQIDGMVEILGEDVDHFTRVVLLEGDALTVSAGQLATELKYARAAFAFGGAQFAHAFSKAKTICEKSRDELIALKDSGLLSVNMGLESGCQELLNLVKPGQDLDTFKAATTRLREIGIDVSINIVAGIGGQKFNDRHISETVSFVRELPEGVGVYFSPLFLSENCRYNQQEQEFGALSADETETQCRQFEKMLGASLYLFIPI